MVNKIFGIGLSKTGTTSLYVALRYLGFRSATFEHMQVLGLREWFRGDFSRDYLQKYDAVTDLPIGCFYPQLDKQYLASKFILTVRDVDEWLESCAKQFGGLPENKFIERTRLISYGGLSFNRDKYRYVYETHIRNVMWYFDNRREDLLVMNLIKGDGWGPLCEFLGVDAPTVPFPNVKPGYLVPQDRQSAIGSLSRLSYVYRRVKWGLK